MDVDDMNDLGSHELRPLDAMNNLGLWVIWKILSCKEKALNAMNKSKLWIIWMIHDLVSLGL